MKLEYSGNLHAIRQVKFQIFCQYEVKTSEMKLWALSEDLTEIQCYNFSPKWEKPNIGQNKTLTIFLHFTVVQNQDFAAISWNLVQITIVNLDIIENI